MQRIQILVVLSLLSCFGCANKGMQQKQAQLPATPVSEKYISGTADNTTQILFLSFTIKQAAPQNELRLKDKIVAQGRLKKDFEQTANPADNNYLKFTFIGSSAGTPDYYVQHPLYKELEFTDEKGGLERKSLVLDSADFFIRTPLLENVKAVTVTEIIAGRPGRELLTLTL